jgi:hypothetical protein
MKLLKDLNWQKVSDIWDKAFVSSNVVLFRATQDDNPFGPYFLRVLRDDFGERTDDRGNLSPLEAQCLLFHYLGGNDEAQ